MKLNLTEKIFISSAAAAVVFTAGYFLGRGSGRDISVTVERSVVELPEASPGDGRVNINTASRAELMTLPNIGEVLAERIVEYREENGPFFCPEELMNVPGIGESVFDSLSGDVTCGFDPEE